MLQWKRRRWQHAEILLLLLCQYLSVQRNRLSDLVNVRGAIAALRKELGALASGHPLLHCLLTLSVGHNMLHSVD